MVKALIAAEADVNAKGVPVDSNPQALNAGNILVPLAYTARVGDLALARILLQNKADINVHDDLGYTPLHSTALAANAEMVKLLLENGVKPRSSRSEEHTSELQSLAYLVCRLLLEK